MNVFVVKKMFEKEGYSVMVVEDGLQVIEVVEDVVFDVILMDINMLCMDGLMVMCKMWLEIDVIKIMFILVFLVNVLFEDKDWFL